MAESIHRYPFFIEAPLNQIWYACYGSNLRAERFNCYIEGGRPKGSVGMESAGSIDRTPPAGTSIFKTDWELFFAKQFIGWGGKGIAFLQPSQIENPASPAQATSANVNAECCRGTLPALQNFV